MDQLEIPMKIFVEQTLRISDCRVCSILKTVPVSLTKSRNSIVCSSSDNSSSINQTFTQNHLVFGNNILMFGGSFDDIFCGYCVRTQIFSKCRKVTISLYSKAPQFHLNHLQHNFWNRFRFLNKHLISSEGFRGIFNENLWKFQTVGYRVFSKPYLAAGYVDTG